MTDGDALLDAIRRQPEDDALRLVYADWLEERGNDERAEFIRAQVLAEGHEEGSAEWERLTARAKALLEANAPAWCAGYEGAFPPLPPDAVSAVFNQRLAGEFGLTVNRGRRFANPGPLKGSFVSPSANFCFERGFVAGVVHCPDEFLDLDPHFAPPPGPLPSLRIRFYIGGEYDREALASQLTTEANACRFDGIDLSGGFSSMPAQCLALAATLPQLTTKLTALHLSEERFGDEELLPILRSPMLTRLRQLSIDYTNCSTACFDVLVRSGRFRSLAYLNLDGLLDGRGFRAFGAPGRWPEMRWLALSGCGRWCGRGRIRD